MIQRHEIGHRSVYVTDSHDEWKDLVSRNQIVYRTEEIALFTQHSDVLDEPFKEFLLRAKMVHPSVVILGVR